MAFSTMLGCEYLASLGSVPGLIEVARSPEKSKEVGRFRLAQLGFLNVVFLHRRPHRRCMIPHQICKQKRSAGTSGNLPEVGGRLPTFPVNTVASHAELGAE